MKTAYDDFLEILDKFKRLSFFALGAGVVVPFFAYVANISPVWPPGVMLLTALVELVCLIVVFQLLRTRGRYTVNRFIVFTAALLCLASLGYLMVFSVFTYVTPHTNERYTKGFVCLPEIKKYFYDKCPLVGRDILSGLQYSADKVWTGWSIVSGLQAPML